MRKNIEVVVAGGLTAKVPDAPVVQKPLQQAPAPAPVVEAAPEPIKTEETKKLGRGKGRK